MLITAVILLLSFLLGLAFLGPTVRFIERVPQTLLFFVGLFFVYKEGTPYVSNVNLGALSVSPMDLASVALLVFCIPYFLDRLQSGFKIREATFLVFLLWVVLIFVNFALGAKEFGIQPATVEFRGDLFFVCVAIFVATRDIRALWPRLEKVFLLSAGLLCVIAFVGYADGNISRTSRPLGAGTTIVVMQAAWVGFFMLERGQFKRWVFLFSSFLVAMVVLLQHRTVWVVLMITGFLALRMFERIRGLYVRGLVFGSVAFGCVGIALFGGTLLEVLEESYREATVQGDQEGSTFLWRIEGWLGLLQSDQFDSPQEILLGNPYGTGWERAVTTSNGSKLVIDVSPHNYYVQTLLRSGLVGLALFIGVQVTLIRKLLHRAKFDLELRPVLRCLALLLIGQLVYYVPYWPDQMQAIFLGAALAFCQENPNSAHPQTQPLAVAHAV